MKRVRLTESDLHKIVKKSVKRYLNEAENGGWYVDDCPSDHAAREFGTGASQACVPTDGQ